MTRIEELEKRRDRVARQHDEYRELMNDRYHELQEIDRKIQLERVVLSAGLMQGTGLRFDSQDAVIITFTRKDPAVAIVELCVRDAGGKFFEIRMDYIENAHRFESVPFDESVELFNEFRAAGKI